MLIKTDVKRAANTVTFSKGEMLFATQKVNDLKYFEEEDHGQKVVHVSASVQGSGENVYQVHAKIDEQWGEIRELNCECIAFETYSGPCKHCVAALLEYISERGAASKDSSKWKTTSMIQRAPVLKRRTSQGLEQLLTQYGMRDKVSYIQESVVGKVELEPFLKIEYGSASVEFKIGVQKKYVVKNIIEFTKAVKAMSKISYGKQLQFIHHIDAFTEQSKPLIRFLLREVEEYQGAHTDYGLFYHGASAIRNWELDGDGLDAFFDAVQDNELHVETDYHEYENYYLTDEHLRRSLHIRGDESGVEIDLQEADVLQGRDYVYQLHDGMIYRERRDEVEEIQPFISYMNKQRTGECYIEKADLALFSRDMLPVLERHFEVEISGFQPEEYLPEKAEFKIFLDAPQKNMVTCKLEAVYGGISYNVLSHKELTERRDVTRELRVQSLVDLYFNGYNPSEQMMVLTNDDELLYELLIDGISRFQELGEVFVSDSIKNLKIHPAPKVNVGVALSGNLLELEIQSKEIPIEQLAALLSKYDRRKKFFRLKNGEFVNLDSDGLEAFAELKDGLQLTEKQLKTGKVIVPKFRAMYLDSAMKDNPSFPVQKNREFRALIRNMKTVEDNDFEIPKDLESVLHGYQKLGYLWLKTLEHNGFGGILADDMGLGKTLQVLCFLLSGKGRTLIVCPASLVYNWKNEIERFTSSLSSKMVVGTAAERKALIEESSEEDILITSYDLLKRDIEIYQNIQFQYEIIDEAQYIKNHTTQAAKAVKLVKAGFRIALTGTPIENRLSELWSIFDYLMPGFLYSYSKFRDELEIPIVQNQDETALKRLQKMIRPFILRRLKKDVLTDLPDKLEENLYAKLDGEQLELYDAHVQRMKLMLTKQSDREFSDARFKVLAELTKLRQICCDPSLLYENYKGESAKAAMCMELIENAVSSGHKILLFSQFTTMLEHLQEQLSKHKISYCVLTGATDKQKRADMVEAFNQDDTSVFCISLKAGGTGLNLTSADIVIHFDPWWNLAVQNQATDRTHRIGQKNVVTVYRLIAKGTIEEKIVELQEKKRELAEQVLESDSLATLSFSKEEMLELLQ